MKIKLVASIFDYLRTTNPLPISGGGLGWAEGNGGLNAWHPLPLSGGGLGWRLNLKTYINLTKYSPPSQPFPFMGRELEFKYLIKKRMKINLFESIFSFPSSHNPLPLRRGRARAGVKAGVGVDMPIAPQHPHPNLPPFRGKEYLLSHQSGKP